MKKGNDGVLLFLFQIQTDPDSDSILLLIVRLHNQRAKGITDADTLILVVQHLLKGRKPAVVHVWRSQRNISERRHFELAPVCSLSGHSLQSRFQHRLSVQPIVGKTIKLRVESAGEKLAVINDK